MTALATTAAIEFDADLLKRMDKQGPRYTSYPTADRFSSDFGPLAYREAVGAWRQVAKPRPLSVYVHIPFCKTVCYYCGCNKIVTRDHRKAATYLDYLQKEIELQSQLFGPGIQIDQLHWGGGTPTYLNRDETARLMLMLAKAFRLADDAHGEFSIEVDPRTADPASIKHLRSVGFNRISLGVQDFDPTVQQAVNRVQSYEQTMEVIQAARDSKFRSVSVDLIYGLPHQTVMSFNKTLQQVIAASPDRIAIYNYAHLPHLFKPQRRINPAELPSAETKLDLLHLSIMRLSEAGYVYIGMDHFAKPDDSLAVAQRQGRLRRNFQGYSTHAGLDVLGLGVSAIGSIGATYHQNAKDADSYYAALDRDELPIIRGMTLSMDDILRRTVIHQLLCQFELPMTSIEQAYPIKFREYFRYELEALRPLEADGLLTIDDDWLQVSLKGRLLIRNICMIFDRYLQNTPVSPLSYSRTL